MSGFLRHLAQRSLGLAGTARPIVPSIFGEWRRAGGDDGLALEVDAPVLRDAEAPARETRGVVAPQPADRGRLETEPDAAAAGARDGPPPRGPVAPPPPAVPAPLPARRSAGERPPESAGRDPAPASTATPPAGSIIPGATSPRTAAPQVDARPPFRRRSGITEAPVQPAAPAGRAADPAPGALDRPLARPAAALAVPVVPGHATVVPPLAAPRVSLPGVAPRVAARDARSAGAAARLDVRPPEERIVEITIGRVEVRATPAPTAGAGRAPVAPRPAQRLEAYLHGRARGING